MRTTLAEEVKWHEGLPWPETTHSLILDLSPMDAAAIFSDVEAQKNIIPRITRSEITKRLSPNEYHIFYKLKVPFPIISTTYTLGNVLDSMPDGSFRTSWYMVESEESSEMKGSVIFSPCDGGTLMTYNNLVVPKNPLAAMFSKAAVKDVGESVLMIAEHLQKTKSCSSLERRRVDYLSMLDAAGAA